MLLTTWSPLLIRSSHCQDRYLFTRINFQNRSPHFCWHATFVKRHGLPQTLSLTASLSCRVRCQQGGRRSSRARRYIQLHSAASVICVDCKLRCFCLMSADRCRPCWSRCSNDTGHHHSAPVSSNPHRSYIPAVFDLATRAFGIHNSVRGTATSQQLHFDPLRRHRHGQARHPEVPGGPVKFEKGPSVPALLQDMCRGNPLSKPDWSPWHARVPGYDNGVGVGQNAAVHWSLRL